MTDPLGQSQVIPYLQGLKDRGHEVWILSCEKPERFGKHQKSIEKLLNDSGIYWIPEIYTSKPPVLSTIKDIRNLKKQADAIINEHKIDVLHCRSYISALVGEAMKKKHGLPWIFDMRGFWADERVDGGLWNLSNPLFSLVYKYFKRKEKAFLKDAIHVISLTENAKQEINSWKGFENVPIQVVPCCADLDLFNKESIKPEAKKTIKTKLEIPEDAFVISYLGSLGTWYMLDEMLDFFKLLKTNYPKAIFLFITGDSEESIIKVAISKGVQSNDLRILSAQRAEVPLLASISDVSIFFIKPVFSKKASSPTKMGELMSLGIPLICNSGVGDVASILEDGGNGVLISEFTKEAYLQAIKELPDVLKKSPHLNVACASAYYALSDGVEKYAGVYSRIA
jgi:glycosyltransferase involved in cell wall biosynthesis